VTADPTEQLRLQLETDAAAWAEHGKAGAGLLDTDQLSELATWLTADRQRELGISETAESFITASRAAARPRWWRGGTSLGGALAILLILATPITLLSIVGLTAALIHRTLN